jgi:hypothetical protein
VVVGKALVMFSVPLRIAPRAPLLESSSGVVLWLKYHLRLNSTLKVPKRVCMFV